MEHTNKDLLLLELIDKPVLCVRDGLIIQMNAAAAQMQIQMDFPIDRLLTEYQEAYHKFTSGQLSVTLTIDGIPNEATVFRTEGMDLFILDVQEDLSKLQSIALAAQQLRFPLNDVMVLTDQLLSHQDLGAECKLRTQAQKINKGLFQLLRIIGNMADAQRYISREPVRMETVNLTALFQQICEKASVLIHDTGIKLVFTGLSQPVFGLANAEHLERGIYNLISNAIKFSPKEGTVTVSVSQNGTVLCLSVQDQGQGIPRHIYSNLFTRYTRQPGIEDGRYGIGIGMALVRNAASVHGGTVLIDRPKDGGTRISLTIPIRQADPGTVSSPILSMFDYAGGWDHALVELSETIPPEKFSE